MKLRPSIILKLYPDSVFPFLFRACDDAQLPLSIFCNPRLLICWNTICGPPLSLNSVTHIIFKSAVSKFQMTFWCIGRGKGQRAMEQIIVGSITFTLHHHSIYNAMLLHKRISKECSLKSDKCTWAQAKLPIYRCTKCSQTQTQTTSYFVFSLSFLWLWGQVAVLLNT